MENTPNLASQAEAPLSFDNLGLAPQILSLLAQKDFVTPTPIQAATIPLGVAGADIIGIAQTGTGKTLAFGLPILHHMVTAKHRGRALIILPTRELALQVEEALQAIGRNLRIRSAVLIGGAPIRPQRSQLMANPDIIIATPGRLIDHLRENWLDLRAVDTLVLDEADRMLDMGFLPQIKQILRAVPEERQTLLFSATMPAEIVHIAAEYMRDPQRVEVARAGTTADNVSQHLYVVHQEAKDELLANVLYNTSGSVLVFARTRSRARRVARYLRNIDISSAEIHADRTLAQRRAALDGFKSGAHRVLVATDIAARGIDVTGIEMVVNYDLPDCADDYVHRIGRTGRAGRSGAAVSFAAPDQSRDVRDIERLVRNEMELHPDSPGAFAHTTSNGASRSPRRGGRGPSQNGVGRQAPPAAPRRPAPSGPAAENGGHRHTAPTGRTFTARRPSRTG